MHAISFFIPAYNCANTLTEAVESILQTNFNSGDELIIVNDCATDTTAQVIQILQNQYPIIQVFEHMYNKGGAATRNTAVEQAKNNLLFCLDSDNVLAPNSIHNLKKYLIEQRADVASFQHQHFFLENKHKPEYIWSLPTGIFRNADYFEGKNTPGQHGNYLFTKKSWLKARGYAEGTGALDTWTFGLRQALMDAKMVVLADTYYYHRLDYKNSYWMRDAEAHMWSVSLKVTYALWPFLDRIDEQFLNYMLGSGRYDWYYQLSKKHLKIVGPNSKELFYKQLHIRVKHKVYPPLSLAMRAFYRLRQLIFKGIW